MNKAYIVSAVRTPIGSFGGILSGFTAVQLGTFAMKGAMEKSGISPDQINEVFFGNVCQANLGQAPSRQAAIAAGIPYNVPCTTVNKVCSSGMKTVMLGAQSIMLGAVDIVMAGGMESMSNIPYYLPKARWGMKYGGGEILDGLEKDGLRDAYDQFAMGIFADRTAEKYGVTREEQDEFAIQSYKRSAHATEQGWFKNEIIGIEVPQRRKDPIMVTEDEEFKKVRFDKIPNLRPAFTKDGTVTAANASTINDGASAIIVASEKAVKQLGLTPIAEIISFADAAHEPEWFTTAPTLAAPRAIKAAGMTPQDVDLYEVNEAFAVVPIVFNKELGITDEKVNIHGGGVSLGHPLGASGARIITTLIHAMDKEGKESGCATLCNGGGGASAIVLKKV
jgi:acetyl-CoA C-acetyltransferase